MVAISERYNTKKNSKEKWPLRTRIVAAIGAAAAMGTLGACSKTEAVHENTNGDIVTTVVLHDDGTVSGSADKKSNVSDIPTLTTDLNGDGKVTIDDVQKLSLENAAKVDPADLTAIFSSELDNYGDDTFNGAEKFLNADQKAILKKLPHTPKESWDDQTVANSVTLGITLSALQPDPAYGKRMLYTFMDHNMPAVDGIEKTVNGDGDAPINVYKVNQSKPIKNGYFNNIKVSPNARAFMMEYVPGDNAGDQNFTRHVVGVYDLIEGSDGKSSNWKVMATIPNDAEVEFAFAQLGQQ